MSRRPLRAMVVALALASITPATAHADPPQNTSSTGTSYTSSTSWGWPLAVLSVATGAVITGASLGIECAPNDLECARWASLGIWSGIGIASLGAAAGLLVVQAHSRTAPVRVTITVERATLVYVF